MQRFSRLIYLVLARGAPLVLAFSLTAIAAQPAEALLININSNALAGSSARLDFQLLDGDLTANNTATISALNGNGTLLGSDCSVGCAGGPPFVIDDGLGLGQFIQDLVLGTALSFDLARTNNFAGGDADLLVLNLLDPNSNFSLIDTNLDALNGPVPYQDALLVYNFGSGQLLFPSISIPTIAVSAAVPELNPALMLFGAILIVVPMVARRRTGLATIGLNKN